MLSCWTLLGDDNDNNNLQILSVIFQAEPNNEWHNQLTAIIHCGFSYKHSYTLMNRGETDKDTFVFFSLSLITSVYFISQDVCRQMDTVFKELLRRQALQEPSSSSAASSPSVQAPQKKGKRDGRRGRGVGLFKAADP